MYRHELVFNDVLQLCSVFVGVYFCFPFYVGLYFIIKDYTPFDQFLNSTRNELDKLVI